MEINVTKFKRIHLFALKGRFDSSTAPELEKALKASMHDGIHNIVLEMSGVEYFGSAAIRALVVAYKECRQVTHMGDVHLSRVPDNIRKVLDISGITPLLQLYEDDVQAVGDF